MHWALRWIKSCCLYSFFFENHDWVFATNSDFRVTISLQPNVVDIRYFKLWILLKYQKFTPSGCKDIEVIIFYFKAKNQFLCIVSVNLFSSQKDWNNEHLTNYFYKSFVIKAFGSWAMMYIHLYKYIIKCFQAVNESFDW